MRWPRSDRRKYERRERERMLSDAEEEVARIRERAEKVAVTLQRRVRRNFWGEAAAAIARREP